MEDNIKIVEFRVHSQVMEIHCMKLVVSNIISKECCSQTIVGKLDTPFKECYLADKAGACFKFLISYYQ